jgi:hypothetical protein
MCARKKKIDSDDDRFFTSVEKRFFYTMHTNTMALPLTTAFYLSTEKKNLFYYEQRERLNNDEK